PSRWTAMLSVNLPPRPIVASATPLSYHAPLLRPCPNEQRSRGPNGPSPLSGSVAGRLCPPSRDLFGRNCSEARVRHRRKTAEEEGNLIQTGQWFSCTIQTRSQPALRRIRTIIYQNQGQYPR